ncbi:MAG: phosphatidylserine/phosphatidylglycerophosphate/cardiolipin synthase family protein [Campylobacter sp.]|nr:phosphatidylserine/phosphatidylglycerophosphate/cardiolipin synthase family protein [Campylobacter sp.]
MKKIFIFLTILALNAYSAIDENITNPAVAGDVSFFINSPFGFEQADERTKTQSGKELIKLINNAQKSVDFAIYGYEDQKEILNALIAAKKRGIIVRGVVSEKLYGQNQYPKTTELIQALKDIKTDFKANEKLALSHSDTTAKDEIMGFELDKNTCVLATKKQKAKKFIGYTMHNKFFIIDKAVVWTGSANITKKSVGGLDVNFGFVVKNSQVAAAYVDEFDRMYEKGLFHDFKPKADIKRFKLDSSDVAVAFCPSPSCLELSLEAINEAKKYIYVGALYIDHEEIAAALINAKQKGVDVRIILDTKRATANTAINELMRASKVSVKIEDFKYKMHAKSIFTENAVLSGSMNFSHASIEHNDENTMLVKNEQIARTAGEFFELLWDSMGENYLTHTPKPKGKSLASQKDIAKVQIVPNHQAIKAQNGKFYTPLDSEYEKIKADKNVEYFCSPYDAKKAGFSSAK